MFEVKPLETQAQADKILTFFFSTHAFKHIWAPGEKDALTTSVYTAVSVNDHHKYWFCEDNGEVIGAIGVDENKYKSGGYIMDDDYFAVHEAYRHKGIGSMLYETVERFVRSQSGRYIHIVSCDIPYYEAARNFYERNGFQKVGIMPDYYNQGEGRVDYYKVINDNST